ncbi:MAG: peptidoglycan editing factor PgeF [Burkholderiales bacterium]|nr:peptidoglycan editing factor PgeF [Burkholderiales bacterium]
MTLPREWLVPDWDAPPRVRAFVTTRAGGVSGGEFASMNLGERSGDDREAVARNRLIVRAELPSMPRWMAQVHGTAVADLDRLQESEEPTADAAIASQPGRVGVVLTADCMPLFLCDEAGTRVAVVHAGWRGMAAGVIESTVRAMGDGAARVLAWMGPTIGPSAFEVGAEVREAFVAVDPDAHVAFRSHKPGKYMADLYALARQRLARAGVERVHGGGFCTYIDSGRFFSYRRVQASGRMGAFIWIDPA